MPFVKDEPMGWEECGDLIKSEIQKVERAIALDGDIAAGDTYPIRSLYSTFNGYGPYLHPRANDHTQRIEDIHGVPEEFRLAICLEHSISLIVSDLIQRYYVDRYLVRQLNEQAVDIKAAQSILRTLKTLIFSYRQQFVQFGAKYAAVRRSCHEVYLQWNDARTRVPPPLREVDLETYMMEEGVVRDLGLELTQLRKMIQTGDMSPHVGV